jgi:hypothetical protein
MVELTINVVSPSCVEQRFYDETGRLVEIRKIYAPRPGGVNNTMRRVSFMKHSRGTGSDPDLLTGS